MVRFGQFLFLGTGSSAGVPVIGCHCAVCASSHVKNKRLRSSGILSIGHKKLLVDAGPDFRQQAIQNDISSLDALFLTHTHYDHVGGLEELRAFTLKNDISLPCFLSEESYESVRKLFYYHFQEKNPLNNRTAEFDYRLLKGSSGQFSCLDETFEYIHYRQGSMPVIGFRVGSFAYLTDLKEYSQELVEKVRGVDVLVTSTLRFGHSKVQMDVDEAVDFIKVIGAKKAYLMHMSHEIDYDYLASLLPQSIEPAYDGLKISFSWELKNERCCY
jgi:phosphoribosyl 1,2-cyclic phosphate phosphodiesterase